jgi:Tol biopolymer transport system component
MKLLRITLFILCVFSSVDAQLRTSIVEKLPLESSHQWNQPQFSSNGKYIYFTTLDFNGIWEYSIESKNSRTITADAQSGFGFALSKDGKQISYRRSMTDERTRERLQELILLDLKTGASTIAASGSEVSTPTFGQNELMYTAGRKFELPSRAASVESIILGIENTKIALSRNGKKVLLDPLGNGSYVWPSLSPDGRTLVAYDMEKGTFVCDVDGKNVLLLGRLDAPTWTRDGKWIVYMDDKDDGHNFTSSEIWAISQDGRQKVQLTATDRVLEMYPSSSPAENKIVCSSLSGELYVISYTEVPR